MNNKNKSSVVVNYAVIILTIAVVWGMVRTLCIIAKQYNLIT